MMKKAIPTMMTRKTMKWHYPKMPMMTAIEASFSALITKADILRAEDILGPSIGSL